MQMCLNGKTERYVVMVEKVHKQKRKKKQKQTNKYRNVTPKKKVTIILSGMFGSLYFWSYGMLTLLLLIYVKLNLTIRISNYKRKKNVSSQPF